MLEWYTLSTMVSELSVSACTGVELCVASFFGVSHAGTIRKLRDEPVRDSSSDTVVFHDTVYAYNSRRMVVMQPEAVEPGIGLQSSPCFLLSENGCAVYDVKTGKPIFQYLFEGNGDKHIKVEDNKPADIITVSNAQPIGLEGGLATQSFGFEFVRSCILDPHWRHYAVYAHAQERRMYVRPFISVQK